MTRFSANGLLLLAALIWGSAFVAQSTAMDTMGPLTFTGLRFVLATLAVAPLAYLEYRRLRPEIKPRHVWLILATGVCFFLGLALQQVGLLYTTVTNSGFLTALYVVFTPLVALFIFRQSVHIAVWPAAALSLAGAWLLGHALSGLNWGDVLTILSALFWALQVILLGIIIAELSAAIVIAALQFAVVAVLGTAFGLMFEPVSFASISDTWFELVYTGVISGGVAFTLQAIAQRYTPAADAAILLSSESLFAALSAMILLGERLPLQGWFGCVAILFAILLVQLAPLVQERRARRSAAV
ncbi:DMT family transporter [Coralliovum pocilloporae]|uniref:DMT family transporter n=1 Tax=Coralliovum pocilloporae TaxID=3066369 RepID=UPI0033074FF0